MHLRLTTTLCLLALSPLAAGQRQAKFAVVGGQLNRPGDGAHAAVDPPGQIEPDEQVLQLEPTRCRRGDRHRA